ncbi:MAG: iron-sulfur cluster biosynthesis family protein [Bacillus sp. (in: firmicutes)]
MEIEFDKAAIDQIFQMTEGKQGILKLIYDTEDCGCGNDGISTLWFIAEAEGDECLLETGAGPVLVDRNNMIYMAECLKISWLSEHGCFRLSSPEGILNPYMKFYNWVK